MNTQMMCFFILQSVNLVVLVRWYVHVRNVTTYCDSPLKQYVNACRWFQEKLYLDSSWGSFIWFRRQVIKIPRFGGGGAGVYSVMPMRCWTMYLGCPYFVMIISARLKRRVMHQNFIVIWKMIISECTKLGNVCLFILNAVTKLPISLLISSLSFWESNGRRSFPNHSVLWKR